VRLGGIRPRALEFQREAAERAERLRPVFGELAALSARKSYRNLAAMRADGYVSAPCPQGSWGPPRPERNTASAIISHLYAIPCLAGFVINPRKAARVHNRFSVAMHVRPLWFIRMSSVGLFGLFEGNEKPSARSQIALGPWRLMSHVITPFHLAPASCPNHFRFALRHFYDLARAAKARS
jgi:hypothetical protein